MSFALTTEQLLPFCSTDETRLTLWRPFLNEDQVMATDGRVLIVTDLDEQTGIAERAPCGVGPVLDDRAKTLRLRGKWRTIRIPEAQAEISEDAVCERCEGSGKGDNGTECAGCEGDGRHWTLRSGRLPNGHAVALRYLRKVLELPGTEFFLTEVRQDKGIPVRGDGWRGVVMPLDAKAAGDFDVEVS